MIARKHLLVLALCSVAGSAIAASAVTSDDMGVGDTRAQAELLPTLTGGAEVQRVGSWKQGAAYARNAVLYAVKIDPDSLPLRIIVDLTRAGGANEAFDPYLRFLNSEGGERYANDDADSSTRNARLDFVLTESGDAGTYYIGVSDASNPRYDVTRRGSRRKVDVEGGYVLSVRAEAAGIPVEIYEPNDTVSDATFMGHGSFWVTWEAILPELDVDIYKISVLQPSLVHAEVLENAEQGSFDPVIRLRNCTSPHPDPAVPDPCGLGTADDTLGLDVGAAVSTVLFEPQDLYVMVSGSPNRAYDPTVAASGVPGATGNYLLDVVVTPFDPTGPFEPNDSIPTATVLPGLVPGRYDQVQVEAFLGDGMFALTRGDRDFYKFELAGESRALELEVAVAIGSALEAVVTVYDGTGIPIAKRDARSGPEDIKLTIPAWCAGFEPMLGPILVMVSSVGQRPPDDLFYPIPDGPTLVPDFGGVGSTGAYRLTLTLGPEAEPVVEPNDTIPTAITTGLVDDGGYVGQSFMGDSACGFQGFDDVDMWSFIVSAPPVAMAARLSACSDSETFGVPGSGYSFRLFDERGKELALHPVFFEDCSAPNVTFETLLKERGTYYLGVASGWSCEYSTGYDPFVACTHVDDAQGPYYLSIALDRQRRAACTELELTRSTYYGQDELFVTLADALSALALRVNSTTGFVESYDGLSAVAGAGSEGLAYDGRNLFFMDGRRYPHVYRSGLATPADFVTWFGSGYFSDIAELGRRLFLLDYLDNSIHVMDAGQGRFICTMPVGDTNGISLSGGLAALAGPNRLYAADAFNTRNIYELSLTGAVTNVLTPMTKRPIALGGIGSDRSTAGGDSAILALGEWEENGLDIFDRTGQLIDVLDLPFPVASCGGNGAIAPDGDFDGDGDLDLADAALLQACFGQPADGGNPSCNGGDVNNDGRVDATDVAGFITVLTGP